MLQTEGILDLGLFFLEKAEGLLKTIDHKGIVSAEETSEYYPF
mgnify:CR=1 FL=1